MDSLDPSSIVWYTASAAAAILLSFAMGLFNWKNSMPVEGKTVLITGASEGMGRSIALQLSAKGANLIAVARNAARLEELVTELKSAAKNPATQRFTYLTADAGLPDYSVALLEAATKWNNGAAPDICWCVAGMATPGLFAETAFSEVRKNTNVNFLGTAELAHSMLRAWTGPDVPASKQNGKKHLILTSTAGALMPCAGYSVYAPSKYALRGLADMLSQEVLLYPEHDVNVHLVMPGNMSSPGYEKENLTKPQVTSKLEEMDPVITPDTAAKRAIAGLERGEFIVVLAWTGWALKWVALGASMRNNWVLDTFMAMIAPIIMVFVLPDHFGTIRNYAKKYRHPVEHPKPNAAS